MLDKILSITNNKNNYKNITFLGMEFRINPLYCTEFASRILDKITPKYKTKIVFNSEPDFSDNPYCFFEYISKNHSKEFQCIIITSHAYPNMKPDKNIHYLYSLKGLYHIFTSKYIISNHCNDFVNMIHSKRHIWINLWHGMPIKTLGYCEKNITNKNFKRYKKLGQMAYQIATSDIFRTIILSCFKSDFKSCFITGLPRNDKIFDINNFEKIKQFLHKDQFKKIILYTPTYKEMIKNGSKEITTEFNNIFYCQDYNRDKFINTLKDNNILFIIKPHPFDEEIYKDKNIHSEYTNIENIKVVFNQDFENMGINLYELFQHTDMMISDYSSIALDYAILNKPIVYLDNLSQDYNKNRGFILEDNYKMFIPGIKVKNFEQLLTTIKSTTHNNQNSKILSEQIPIIHKYVDNKSCERIYKIMKGLQ